MKKKVMRRIGTGLLAAALLLPASSVFASDTTYEYNAGNTNTNINKSTNTNTNTNTNINKSTNTNTNTNTNNNNTTKTTTTNTTTTVSNKYTDNSVRGLINIGDILSGSSILSNNQINLLNGNGIGILGLGGALNSGNTTQNN